MSKTNLPKSWEIGWRVLLFRATRLSTAQSRAGRSKRNHVGMLSRAFDRTNGQTTSLDEGRRCPLLAGPPTYHVSAISTDKSSTEDSCRPGGSVSGGLEQHWYVAACGMSGTTRHSRCGLPNLHHRTRALTHVLSSWHILQSHQTGVVVVLSVTGDAYVNCIPRSTLNIVHPTTGMARRKSRLERTWKHMMLQVYIEYRLVCLPSLVCLFAASLRIVW
jgi:hypothetical protein